jgi:hypothetical protein
MSLQTTLLTSHKGVDLHAATALLVMKDRLEGGDRLVNLLRCEVHTFWGKPDNMNIKRLLDTGRYFNPNKHHYGVFVGESGLKPWFDCTDCRGQVLPVGWPGAVADTDLPGDGDGAALYQSLLGGHPAEGQTPVDVISFELGQSGPVLSGVLWRMVISGDPATAQTIGMNLAVARERKQGLLINPHMEAWLSIEQEQA